MFQRNVIFYMRRALVMFRMEHRYDILTAANSTRFYLRHYARGIYPPASLHPLRLPVNRMFFPLRNPNGKCNYIRDRQKTYPLEPGRFYFIPAFYAAEVHLDEDVYFLSIQSNLEICPGTELFSDCSSMQVLPAPAELPLLLNLFESPPEKLPFTSLELKIAVFTILVRLLMLYPAEDFRNPLLLRHYSVLTDYLAHNGDASTRVSELAEFMKESRESFTRRFSSETGITPKQLIDRFLMSKALDLLNGNASIKEVAFRLKFSSEFAFSRFFKKHMGEAPNYWRKNSLFPGGRSEKWT